MLVEGECASKMSTILLEKNVSESEDTVVDGDTTSDEDLDALSTDIDVEMTADESAINNEVASKLVTQEVPPLEELELESPCDITSGRGKRLISRLLSWVIWLLGICFRRLAIVLHVCWLAATGGNVGVSGLWEVLSLLVVVLAQELLQLMLVSRNQASASSNQSSIDEERAISKEKTAPKDELGSSTADEAEVVATKDEEVLKVETAGDTLSTDFCELNNVLPNSSTGKFLSKSSKMVDSPVADLGIDEMAPTPVATMGLEGSPVGDVGGGPKTSWGMDVTALIAQHPSPKMPVPVWDLYAPSEAPHPPTTLSCLEEGPRATEGNTPNSLATITAPVTPQPTDSSPGNIF